jgi:glyoxylase-like metal-dependent hydrolase (beta-lactamase superfamily II)
MATFSPEPYDESTSLPLLVCSTCGTQHPTTDRQSLTTCFICDDPRQYVPPSGQSFITLADLREAHKNIFTPYAGDERLTFIQSEPKVGIGQRAILIRTPLGNVLWDCVTLLDEETIEKIKGLGGLKAIVISHPHFYSTHVEWGRAFGCPVYLSGNDRQWLARKSSHQVFLEETETELVIDGKKSGVQAMVLGGHFPGSMVLLFDGRLMIADTLFTGACPGASCDHAA